MRDNELRKEQRAEDLSWKKASFYANLQAHIARLALPANSVLSTVQIAKQKFPSVLTCLNIKMKVCAFAELKSIFGDARRKSFGDNLPVLCIFPPYERRRNLASHKNSTWLTSETM